MLKYKLEINPFKPTRLHIYVLLLLSAISCSAQTFDQLYVNLRNAKTEMQLINAYSDLGLKYANKPKIDSALFYAEKINQLSRKTNNAIGLAKGNIIIAITKQVKNDYAGAWQKYVEALSLSKNDAATKAQCYYCMGRNKNLQEQYAESNEYFKKAELIFENLKDSSSLYAVYEKQGINQIMLYNIDSAILYLFKAKMIAEDLKDSNKISNCNYNLSNYFISLGDYNKANEFAVTAIAFSKNINVITKRNIYSNLVVCNIYLNQLNKAEEEIKTIEQYNATLKDEWGTNLLNKLKSKLAFANQDFDSAAYYLNLSLEGISFVHTDPKKVDLQSIFELGEILFFQNKLDTAEATSLLGLQLAEVAQSALFKMNNCEILSKIYQKKGNDQKANLYLNTYVKLRDTLLNIQRQSVLITQEVVYETEKKQLAIIHLESEKKIQNLLVNQQYQLIINSKTEAEKKEAEVQLLKEKQSAQAANEKILSTTIKNQNLENDKVTIENKSLQTERLYQQATISKQTLLRNTAILISGLLLLFGVFTYSRYLKRRKLSNQLSQSLTDLKSTQQQLIQIEREKEAENIRLRISRDIHDDIGHSLTKISLLSDMTANDKQINSPEAIETLGRISDYSRNVNASLSEIVWAISPTHDSLDSLIVYMRNHIHKFFENTGITYKINFSDTYENRPINPELKRNVFLVLKESLNNILKYAKAKNVIVDFKIDDDQFELKIKDDGVGFTPLSFGDGPGVRIGGNGLPNMKYRIEQTGGSFEINSSAGNGCEIKVNGSFNS